MLTLTTFALIGILEGNTDTTSRPTTTSSASEESSAVRVQPAPPSGADSVVAAAFGKNIGTVAENLKADAAPAPTFEWTNLVAPTLALLGLAGLAFALRRRQGHAPRNIRVVETAAIGPRRSLVIADILGERVVLAVSEAGMTVLSTRAAPSPALEPHTEPESLQIPDIQPIRRTIPTMGFFQRLFGKPAATQPFDEMLGESIEDQELRAKLAAGLKGYVP